MFPFIIRKYFEDDLSKKNSKKHCLLASVILHFVAERNLYYGVSHQSSYRWNVSELLNSILIVKEQDMNWLKTYFNMDDSKR